MKKFTKLLGIVLIIALVMSMGTMALAANTPVDTPTNGFTVNITPDTTDEGVHSYEAYQIFKGDLVQDENGNKILSNIKWGTGIAVDADFVAAIEALRDSSVDGYKQLTTSSTAAEFASAIGELNAKPDDATAQAIASAIGAALTSTTAGTGSASGVSGLQPGYYLIQDAVNPTAPNNNSNSGAMTRYILQVVGTVTVEEKASVPSVEKKVADNNDTDKFQPALEDVANADWKDSADYDIGDEVPFQITATTASTTSDYVKYHVTIQDKQSSGLDAPESYTISVLGKTLTLTAGGNAVTVTTDNGTKITAENATPDSGNTFAIKVTFENNTANSKINAEANSKGIVVKYSAVLNEDAVIGATGNPNEVYLKYSNNPNSDEDKEEGKTPTDTVIVFTYKTTIDKVDDDGDSLAGADFMLYKEVAADGDGNYPTGAKTGAKIKETFASNVSAKALADAKYYVEAGKKAPETVASTTTQFSFKGIDDGTYVLVETTVPSGYNAWDAVEFKVTANHSDGDAPALTSLTGTKPFNSADEWKGIVEVDKTKTGQKYTTVSGELYTEIVNQSGTVLPSTGGIGTTIFYVVGSILVVAAGVLLITKKRMNREG